MKLILLPLGASVFLAGLFFLLLPIPLGLPLMAAGTALAYPHCRPLRDGLQRIARRRPALARLLDQVVKGRSGRP